MRAALLAASLALVACRRAPAPTAPTTREGALRELARCAFDGLPAAPAPPELEAALRRALREGRYDFAVRAGRCETALDPALRERDARARALGDAWDELLPLAQATAPDDIALERAVRHVGLAWRAAQ